MNSSTVGITGFAVGDKIQIQATPGGSSQILELVGYANFGNTVVSQTPLPGVINYTVTGTNDDTDLYLAISVGTTFIATITATCNLQSPTNSSDASRAAVKQFLLSRINGILLNDPSSVSLLNQSTSSVPANATSTQGTNFSGTAMGLQPGLHDLGINTSGGTVMQFSQSLSQLRRQAREAQAQQDMMALGGRNGSSPPRPYEEVSRWDFWVEGAYSAFRDDRTNLDRKGYLGVMYFGSHYRLAENTIVGVMAQFDWARDDSVSAGSKVAGNGWMAGPYMSTQLSQNLYLDLRAAWGRSSNDLTLGSATGSFDTSRWLIKGKLAGNWLYDAWRITPSAELAYFTERADDFTNSAGVFIAGQDVSLGRLQFGPEIGYRFAHTANTFIEPFAGIKGVWDFHNPNATSIDGITGGPGEFWGRLLGGLNVATTSGWAVRGLASWDGVGASHYKGYTLRGSVNIPLN